MRKTNQWIALALMATLGGCFFAYDYEPTANSGGAGGGGMAASTSSGDGAGSNTGGNGGSAGSSSSSSSGSSSSGGACTVNICVPGGNPNCVPGVTCAAPKWAHRYGTSAKVQQAQTLAIADNGDVVIGGRYVDEQVPVGPYNLDPQMGKNGFLAKLDTLGDITGLTIVSGMDVRAVAVDRAHEVSAVMVDSTGTTAALGHWEMLSTQKPAPKWSRQFVNVISTAIAVDDPDRNIYVLGEAGGSATLEYNGSQTPVSAGFFVVSYTSTGTGRWIYPFLPTGAYHAAAITAKNGLWITGYFGMEVHAGAGGSIMNGNGRKNMFLIGLDPVTGKPGAMRGYYPGAMGDIEPSAIDADASSVYVVGTVTGSTEFDTKLGMAPSAFVFKLGQLNGSAYLAHVFREEKVDSDKFGARATGVTSTAGRLYIGGTYSGAIKIDPMAPGIESPDMDPLVRFNTPFIAQLDPATLVARSFSAFPGNGEPFVNDEVHFAAITAANVDHLYLAGGWSSTLDFRQATGDDKLELLQLTPVAMPPNNDIFIAKFTAMP